MGFIGNEINQAFVLSRIHVPDFHALLYRHACLQHAPDHAVDLCVHRFTARIGQKAALLYDIADGCHRLHQAVPGSLDQALHGVAAHHARHARIGNGAALIDRASQIFAAHGLDDRVAVLPRCEAGPQGQHQRRVRKRCANIFLRHDGVDDHLRLPELPHPGFRIHQHADDALFREGYGFLR